MLARKQSLDGTFIYATVGVVKNAVGGLGGVQAQVAGIVENTNLATSPAVASGTEGLV